MSNKTNVISAVVVALVTSLLAFAFFTASLPPVAPALVDLSSSEDLGAIQGTVLETPYVFKNGSGDGGDFLTFTVNGRINAGSNQAAWRNTTNRTVYVDYTEMIPTGTASTTFIFYVGTSTASTYSNNYAAPYATLVDGKRIATSTTPIVINSRADAGTLGRQTIAVAPGVYVNFAMLQGYLQAGCSGAVCEAATSTNRGISTIDWLLRGHYKP